MKTVRVLVLVAMGVSAFCGFAQDGAPGAGAPTGGAVVLNRTKAAPAKRGDRSQRTSIRLRRFRMPWSKVRARILSRLPRA